MVEEVPRHLEMLGVLEGHFAHARAVEQDDLRVRVRQQDRRVRGDDQLRMVLDQLVDGAQRRQLAIGRQGGLGFVEEVHAVAAQLLRQHAHERFAVRLGVQLPVAVAVAAGHVVHVGRHVEEALGPQEVAVFRDGRDAGQPQVAVQRRDGSLLERRLQPHGPGAAFLPESHAEGQRFQHGGFARAVLAHEEGDVGMEVDLAHLRDRRNAVGVGALVDVGLGPEAGAQQVGLGAAGHVRSLAQRLDQEQRAHRIAQLFIHMQRMGIECPDVQAHFDASPLRHPVLGPLHQFPADAPAPLAGGDSHATHPAEAHGLQQRVGFRDDADGDEADERTLRFGDEGRGIVPADAALPVRRVPVRRARAGEDGREGRVVHRIHFLAERADRVEVGFGRFAVGGHAEIVGPRPLAPCPGPRPHSPCDPRRAQPVVCFSSTLKSSYITIAIAPTTIKPAKARPICIDEPAEISR